jgi:GNAT superfamily N-acetyltransferase
MLRTRTPSRSCSRQSPLEKGRLSTRRHLSGPSVLNAAEAVDVILRDGGTLRLRPPGAEDADGLVAFFSQLSERSLYLRFHGAVRPDARLARQFVDPDWVERGSLLGTLEDRIVALASYARLREPTAAEIAFAVSDEEQGRGIGTRLLEQLAGRAAGAGITSFVAEVMAENRAALGVFADAGFEVVRELEGGEVELRFRSATASPCQRPKYSEPPRTTAP